MPRFGTLVVFGALAVDASLGGGVVGVGAAQAATDPCKLLRVREVEKTLGQAVAAGVPSSEELPGNGGSEVRCTWETTAPDTGFLGGTRLQLVASVQSNCARPDVKGCFRLDELDYRDEAVDVKKLGNDAFYVFTGEVQVRVGKRIVNVHFNNFDTNMFSRKDFQRRTVDAAKKAVKRL
jgi:hypothetical protein